MPTFPPGPTPWRLGILLLALLLVPAALRAESSGFLSNSLPVIRDIRSVRMLSMQEAGRRYPVQLEAIVTHRDPPFLLFFVTDATAGIYIFLHEGAPKDLVPGDRVQIKGRTDAGITAPIIVPSSLVKTGSGPLPEPYETTIGQTFNNKQDGQWIRLRGSVRSIAERAGHLQVMLADGENELKVWIQHYPKPFTNDWYGAWVEVRGVGGTAFNDKRQAVGFHVYVSSTNDVRILQHDDHGPQTVAAASTNLFPVRKFGNGDLRVKVRGVVTYARPGFVVIDDSTGPISLAVSSSATAEVGDLVEAAGFPAAKIHSHLGNTQFKVVGKAAPPPAVSLPLKQISGDRHARKLVQVDGEILGHSHVRDTGIVLTLRDGEYVRPIWLWTTNQWDSLDDVKVGSRVAVKGIAWYENGVQGETASLWMRSTADLEVTGPPEGEWNSSIVISLIAITAVLAIGVLSALYAIHQQRWSLRSWQERYDLLQMENRENALQLRQSIEERERIAQDLHDDIIQSVFAVGLSMDDCRMLIAKAPEEAQSRLRMATTALNDVIRQVRSFIGGLEPKALNGRELKTALKSFALTLGDQALPLVIEVDQAAATALTSRQATQVFMIAKEAISNSVKHSHAQNIKVSLRLVTGCPLLEIVDDGTGFDPSISSQGMGLRNMAARCRELGARLDVASAPDQGTRVSVLLT